MKGILLSVPESLLAERRRTGLDRMDEMWEGVLHMVPAPGHPHQQVAMKLVVFLDPLLSKTGRGQLLLQENVFVEAKPERNYRIPDLAFVAKGREHILHKQGVRGGPDAVIEIKSPDDETYEKFEFYRSLGVHEIFVIHPETRLFEVHRLESNGYARVLPAADGSVVAQTLLVKFRTIAVPRLLVEDAEDPSNRMEI